MGVNLVTRVRNFSIQSQTFSASDHDVQDGCVTPGSHKFFASISFPTMRGMPISWSEVLRLVPISSFGRLPTGITT